MDIKEALDIWGTSRGAGMRFKYALDLIDLHECTYCRTVGFERRGVTLSHCPIESMRIIVEEKCKKTEEELTW